MRRKIRDSDSMELFPQYDFKHEIVKDLLYQIDYQTAYRHKVVTVSEKDMVDELSKISTGALISWYLAYLYIRRELMHAGYELNGLKVIDMPIDTIHDKMKTDPDFDINSYIF